MASEIKRGRGLTTKLFVLSLLGSHDSVSLCVVLLNKIRFVYDFVLIQM